MTSGLWGARKMADAALVELVRLMEEDGWLSGQDEQDDVGRRGTS